MIPIAIPNIGPREAENLAECVSSTMVSTVGPFVTEFENGLTELSKSAGAVSTTTGTSALHAALHYFGVGHGDLVIIPSMTFIATANAVAATGASPWIFDCTASDWTLDCAQVAQALEAQTEPHPDGGRVHKASGHLIKAIVPVMTMGANPDFGAIATLRKEFDLRVVVDAAAAVGATTEQGPLGAVDVDAVCFSFNGNKTITCGGGGAIISSNIDTLADLRHLTTTGRVGRDYDHDIFAFNYRMTNVNAAIGVAQLQRLHEFLRKKADIQESYSALASDFAMLAPFPSGYDGHSTHWFSGFHYTGDDPTASDRFRAFMQTAGVDLRKFWKPIHLQMPYLDSPCSDTAVSDALWEGIFTLPCSTNLTYEELDHVLKSCHQFWKGEAA